MMRTHLAGTLRGVGHRRAGRRVRLGRVAARPRRRRVPRPARHLRDRPGGRGPGRSSATRCTASAASGCCGSRARCGRGPRARSTPTCRRARSRSPAATLEVLNEAEPPPFPLAERADDVDEVLRLRHRYLDLRASVDAGNLRAPGHGQRGAARVDGRRRTSSRSRRRCSSRRRPRARATSSCRRGCTRIVLRAAAEPAAVQAAADGRRARPLLPDRPLPARRGPARRPPVRVHAVRRGDVVRGRRRTCSRSSAEALGAAIEAVTGARPGRRRRA